MPQVTDSSKQYEPLPTDESSVGKKLKQSWFTRFFRKHYHWLLYLKTLPSILLLGTFGRRPITIAKLASPAIVESFAAFLGPLLGPILFLALIDSLYIIALVIKDNWRIKQYESEKARLLQYQHEEEEPEQSSTYIQKIRNQIEKIPESQRKQHILEHMLDASFKRLLTKQHIHLDIFIDHLLKTNSYTFGPRDFPGKYPQFMGQTTLDYPSLWIGAQLDYCRLRLKDSEKHLPTDPEAKRLFILNNVLSTRTRSQLGKMGIDEDQFVEKLQDPSVTESQLIAFFKLGKKTGLAAFFTTTKKEKFEYDKEWLITEVKALQYQALGSRNSDRLIRAMGQETADAFIREATIKNPNNKRYEFSDQNIINRFKCLTTEKDFEKEHPLIGNFIEYYEKGKKLFVFPLRMISLGLAIEVMMPFSLPIVTSIMVYMGMGLALSLLIIALETLTDDYLKELKGERETELETLHESERVGTFSRLSGRLSLAAAVQENTLLRNKQNPLTGSMSRSQSLVDLGKTQVGSILSFTGKPFSREPEKTQQGSPEASPISAQVTTQTRHRSESY